MTDPCVTATVQMADNTERIQLTLQRLKRRAEAG
jgi:hypothetical protein